MRLADLVVGRWVLQRDRTGSIITDLAIRMVLFGFVGMFVLIGLGLSMWSLYLLLSQFVSPPAAGSVTALCSFLLAACLFFIAARMAGGMTRGKETQPKSSLAEPMDLVREKPLETVLAAFSVGIIMGISPDTRKVVTETALSLLERSNSEKP